MTIAVFIAVHYIPPTAVTDVDCILDFSHEKLAGVNKYFQANPDFRKGAMISSAFLCDVCTVGIFYVWTA